MIACVVFVLFVYVLCVFMVHRRLWMNRDKVVERWSRLSRAGTLMMYCCMIACVVFVLFVYVLYVFMVHRQLWMNRDEVVEQ